MADKEDLILSQILKNNYFRDKVIQYIKPYFFEETENENVYTCIQKLVNEDKVKQLDVNTVLLKCKDSSRVNYLFGEVDDYPIDNIPFLLKETEEWGKERILQQAILDSHELVNNTKKDRGIVGSLIKDALAFSFDKDLGHNYIKDIHDRFESYKRIEQKITTGFDMLDMFTHGGLQNKTLTVGAGHSGLGKTLLGTNLTATLIQNGYSGVYLTLEMAAKEGISKRIDSIISRIPYNSLFREEGRATNEILRKVKGKLYVREYLPSKACCANIMGYIRDLQSIEKYKIDFLVVDYIQLMKPNFASYATNSYEKYKMIAEELREIAQELNIPVITFSQVQRSAFAGNLGLSNIADSIGIVNTSDLMIGMTQTEAEEEGNFQTWKIIKNRFGRKNVVFRVQMDEELLCFNQIINEEERIKLEEFKNRDISIIEPKSIKEESLEIKAMEKQEAEAVNDFKNFVEENDTAEDSLFKGFS